LARTTLTKTTKIIDDYHKFIIGLGSEYKKCSFISNITVTMGALHECDMEMTVLFNLMFIFCPRLETITVDPGVVIEACFIRWLEDLAMFLKKTDKNPILPNLVSMECVKYEFHKSWENCFRHQLSEAEKLDNALISLSGREHHILCKIECGACFLVHSRNTSCGVCGNRLKSNRNTGFPQCTLDHSDLLFRGFKGDKKKNR
jgi:hypothetical protein